MQLLMWFGRPATVPDSYSASVSWKNLPRAEICTGGDPDDDGGGIGKNVRRPVGQTEPCRSVGTPFRGHCDLCSIDGIRTHTKALGPRSFPLVKRYSLNYYAKNQLIKLCDQYIRSRLPTGRKLDGIASWTHVGFEPLRLRAKEKCYRYTTWPMDYCTSGGTRTHNPGIKSAMLCQLSYKGGYWGHRWDSNPIFPCRVVTPCEHPMTEQEY